MLNRRSKFLPHFRLGWFIGIVLVLVIFAYFDFPISISNSTDSNNRKKRKKSELKEGSGTRVENARPVPAFTIPDKIPGKQYTYFIALGDWGTGGEGQKRVAQIMNEKAGRDSLHFVLTLGDNFYGDDLISVTDPQWQAKFESVYNLPFLNVPFFASLGNHDYQGTENPEAQIEYSRRNSRWQMPARYYTFTRQLEQSAAIQFFALDTYEIVSPQTEAKSARQLEWLENELKKSQATWKVVFGHNPVFSNGEHGGHPLMQKHAQLVFERYKIDFYLCGHEHDRQLLQPVAGVHYVVSGTGALSDNTKWADNSIFAASDIGFAWCRVAADEFHIQFVDKNGEVEFAYTLNKSRQKAIVQAANEKD